MIRRSQRHRKGALALLCLSAACAAPAQRVTLDLPAEPLEAVAVAPLVLHAETVEGDLAVEAFKRSQKLLAWLWRETELPVLAPDEWTLYDPRGANPMTATDLYVRAQALGLDPQRLCLLSMSVTSRKSSGQKVITKDGHRSVGNAYHHTLALSMSVRDMKGHYLLEAEMTADVDPFAETPDWDRRPELEQLLLRGAALFADKLAGALEETPRGPLRLAPSPAVILDAPTADGGTLRDVIAAADPLERDRLLWLHQQYLDPEITLDRARQSLRTPSGVCIEGEPPAPFRTGDCVAAVGTEPVRSPQALDRILLSHRAVDLRVVGADGEVRVVSYPDTFTRRPLATILRVPCSR